LHYYKRNIGDYHKKAGRLSIVQHGVYTLLIDACYDREVFPTLEEATEWCWASSKEEIEAVEFVLTRFFEKREGGIYVQKRIEEELKAFNKRSITNTRIAIERETNRKEASTNRAEVVHDPSTECAEIPPNHKPLTTNHNNNTSPKPARKPKYEKRDLEFAEWAWNVLVSSMPNMVPPNLETWANHVRLMREKDKRDYEGMTRLWLWARNDNFWQANILSMKKFREKFDTLCAQAKRKSSGGGGYKTAQQQAAEMAQSTRQLNSPDDLEF
jgi:uncharacterized protein YdaU (DUF1376 family)